MKIEAREIIAFAKQRGFMLNSPETLAGHYDIEGCLPMSEQDDLAAGTYENDAAYDRKCRQYFLDWAAEYINGFCPSKVDKVIVGHYMATRRLFEIEIV